MPVKSRNTASGLCWAGAAILVWSGSLVMLRLGITTSLNAYDLTMLRFGVAALVLAPVLARRGAGTRRLRLPGIVAMLLAFGAPYALLIALAMKTAPASAAGALNPGVMAIVSVVLGRAYFGDKIGSARLGGLFATIMGIALFTMAGGAVTPGHLILIATGTMWAIYIVIVRRAEVPAMNATAIIAVGSAVFYLPVYFAVLPKQIYTAPVLDILIQAGFQGVLVSFVAIYAFNRSVELLGPAAGAAMPALIPVATLCLGVTILDETAGAEEFWATALMTTGLILILGGMSCMRYSLSRVRLFMVGTKHSGRR